MPSDVDPQGAAAPDVALVQRRNRSLSIAVIVLAVTLIGLVVWTLLDTSTTTGTEATPDIDRVIADYFAASNAYDPDAWLAVVSDDYRYYQAPFNPIFTSSSPAEHDATADEIARRFHPLGQYPTNAFRWDRIGEPVMTGDGPWNVAQAIRLTTKGYVLEGVTTLTVVDEDGAHKISRDVFITYEIPD